MKKEVNAFPSYRGGQKWNEDQKRRLSESLKGKIPWNAGKSIPEEMKEKFFGSYDDFVNLRSEVKQQFLEFYEALDISSDELKK
jgi:hypothetical protein